MKKVLFIAAILMMTLPFISQAQPENSVIQSNQRTVLTVSPENIKVKPEGGTISVTVNSNKNWSHSGGSNWINLNKLGKKIQIKVSPNSLQSTRSCSFVVKAADKTVRVQIVQGGKVIPSSTSISEPTQVSSPTTLKLSHSKITMDSEGGVRNVTVSSNKTWSFSGGGRWFSLQRNGNSIQVKVVPNTSQSSRSGYFIVKTAEKKEKVRVFQKGKSVTYYLNISKSSLKFGFPGGTDYVSINSNTDWYLENIPDWLSINKENGGVRITTQENRNYVSRSCTIRVKTNYHTKNIYISQEAKPQPYINMSSDLEEFTAQGGKCSIIVDSNVSWNMDAQTESWVTILRNGNRLNISVEKNKNDKLRVVEVKLRAKDSNIVKKVLIKQRGSVLSLSSRNLNFDRSYGYKSIEVTSDPQWEIGYNAHDWVSFNKKDNVLSVGVKKNKKFRTRRASVAISNGNLSQRVYISQKGRVFNTLEKKHRRVVGLSMGYVQKHWKVQAGKNSIRTGYWDGTEYMHGAQVGFRIEPLFKYGFGINTGVFYEFYYSKGETDYHYGESYQPIFQEHALYVPFHLEYRLNFSRKFQLFFYGGASFDYGLMAKIKTDNENLYFDDDNAYEGFLGKRYNVSYEYGGGMRLGRVQFNFTVSRGLINMSQDRDFEIKQNKDIMGAMTIMF